MTSREGNDHKLVSQYKNIRFAAQKLHRDLRFRNSYPDMFYKTFSIHLEETRDTNTRM